MRLKENTYYARTGSGSFLLSYDGLLRLDETVASNVVESAVAPEPHLSDQSVTVTGRGAMSTALAAALTQCGLRVRVVQPAHPDAETLNVAHGDHGLRCYVAANDAGVCWSFSDVASQTPVAPPLAAFRRAASFGTATASSDGLGPQVGAETLTTIAAKQIARGLLRSSQQRQPAGVVAFLDRRTLRTSTHRVTVHPYDPAAEQRTQPEFRRDLRELHDGPSVCREELTQRWRRLCDERFGAFADLDDADFRQLPLKVTLARMSDPCGLLSEPPAVVGVGVDSHSARERAMVQALATYGSIVVDPRLLVDYEGAFLCPRDDDGMRLLGSVRDGSVDAFVRAVDLADGRERLLPARQAFPVLRTRQAAHPPCGTSAALDWRQAVTHGLLQHCARLTVSGSSSRPRPPSALAPEDFDQDPGIRFLAAMVQAAGLDLILRDITGPAGVPVVACSSTLGQEVYGAGTHLAEAVREALTAALFHYQVRRDPALRAAVSSATSAIWTNPLGSASISPGRMLDALTGLGYTPSVIVLDHDRAVHEALPYVLRVTVEQRLPRA